ncbi:MAG TPA: PDDEXK nuclease domain-containing protein [Candidatus Goldiibacteriota bacterium]|nr:PDDEXK nuclease domain-containing protein [Candidatus Goldiibacteriota bacterium]HPN63995.1 PDDEXK nuclease domain-containing protein [Candidatus Goldiibacteriota bacterium]HRQ43855.1 PDDEXK nuclease domain-containing protein [Candidatus Goldiibacteriota bacterium]
MRNKVISRTEAYSKIRVILNEARLKVYKAVNTVMVRAYWEIGRVIVEQEQKGSKKAEYGGKLLENLSKRLSLEFGQGFDASNLSNMRKLYLTYPILDALRQELSWTHYRILIRIDNKQARDFYEIECAVNHWSARELERQKSTLLFERLALSKNKKEVMKMAKKGQELQTYGDMIKDPYILEFTGLPADRKMYENSLEQALIENLSKFLLELGKGFTFVASQKRISFEGEHYYIDLVFYNTILKCYMLIDLKIGRLKHQDIGQMQMYVNYFDRELKEKNDNPTVGLILCEDKKDTVIKYTLPENNKQIFASRYKLYLPTEKELRNELNRDKKIIGQYRIK